MAITAKGLGDHGERFHGHLLYQGVMRVPLLVAGSGIAPAIAQKAVSIRQIYATVRSWAGQPTAGGLLDDEPRLEASPVLAEALKPFRQYGGSRR